MIYFIQIHTSASTEHFKKTPTVPRTPQLLGTPTSVVKTPQRSILKDWSANSVTKKRRVVFALKDEDEASNSGDSCTFEVMEDDVSSSVLFFGFFDFMKVCSLMRR